MALGTEQGSLEQSPGYGWCLDSSHLFLGGAGVAAFSVAGTAELSGILPDTGAFCEVQLPDGHPHECRSH